MKKIIGFMAVVAVCLSSNVVAEIDTSKLYAGGNAALNRIGDEGAFGFQGFVGYDFKEDFEVADNISLASELGYSYSGEWNGGFKTKGLWAAAVFSIELSDELNVINRLGYSFADKNFDGLVTGLGLEYQIDEQIAVRGEIVMQGYKSYQAGAVFRF